MTTYPATIFSVPPRHRAICLKYRINDDWYLFCDGVWGDFGTYRAFLTKEERFDMAATLRVNPTFDGELNVDNVEKMMINYTSLDTGIAFIDKDRFVLCNPVNRLIDRWAVFLTTDGDSIPVHCTISEAKFVDLDDMVDLANDLQLNTRPAMELSQANLLTHGNNDMNSANRISRTMNTEWVKNWFSDTIVMNVPGDGLCGAHSLHNALFDINIYVTLEEICHALTVLEHGRTSWWSAEVLREYCRQIGVRLLIKQITGREAAYWWTTNMVLPIIGIWANGTHYQWCKKITRSTITEKRTHDGPSPPGPKRQKSVSFSSDSIGRSIKDHEDIVMEGDNDSHYSDEVGRKRNGRTIFDAQPDPILIDRGNPATKEKIEKFGIDPDRSIHGPKHLQQYLDTVDADDAEITYDMPEIINDLRDEDIHYWHDFTGIRPIIPKRMDNPLVRLPHEIAIGIATGGYGKIKYVHNHWRPAISGLSGYIHKHKSMLLHDPTKCDTNINLLKDLTRQNFGMETQLLSDTIGACAREFTMHDFNIACGNEIPLSDFITKPPNLTSYHIFIATLRHLLVQSNPGVKVRGTDYEYECETDGRYYMRGTFEGSRYTLLSCGSLFYLEHECLDRPFIGTITYLDYTITYTEVRHSLKLLMSTKEYEWMNGVASLLLTLSESYTEHNDSVELIKTFEGLCLHISDMIDTSYINWNPALDAISDFVNWCNKCTGQNATTNDFFDYMYDSRELRDTSTLAEHFFYCLSHLNGTQLQEISSIHKFLFYAEIDAEAGMRKFLSRVHTKRVVDPEFIAKMVHFARRNFTLEYMKRHGSVPNFKEENQETETIRFCMRNKLLNQLEKESIDWWSTVIPYNCLSISTARNVLEVAKDKGALKKEVKFGPGDSHRELLQVIETPERAYAEIDLDAIPEKHDISIKIQRSEKFPVKDKWPTRIIPKEREQKIAARLFGNANLDNKHGLSYKMLKAKKALSYFNSEVMTKSDKERKLKLHRMAQSLKDPTTYCLMLDIEGHNQSMQKDNAGAIYEFVGLLYGEENWSKLADYFSAQTVYLYDEFYDKVMVSKGQHGGIEGWYNPLWTLHSTLVSELIPYETTIDLKECAVYSDDVALSTQLPKPEPNILNLEFSQMTKHYARAGLTVKMKQTAMSRNRVTLLRSHYCKGWKSDSSIKRLLAVSTMNNPNFASEELEVAGVCSTLSSSLELSEHILPITYIKWYYISLCTVRLFAAYMEKPRTSILWELESTPKDIQHLLFFEKGDRYLHGKKTNMELALDLARVATEKGVLLPDSVKTTEISDTIQSLFGINAAEFQTLQVRDLVYYMLLNNDLIKSLFFLILTLPTSVGGKNSSLMINDILSGHSDGFHKQIHYLHQWLHFGKGQPVWIQDIMKHALRVPTNEIGQHQVTELCISTWPTVNYPKNINSLITKRIKGVISHRCVNRAILKLLSMDQHRQDFQKKIADLAKDDLQPRVLQFYTENSSFHILDILIKKIETSSGFCSLIPKLSQFRKQITKNELLNIDKMFRMDTGWFPDLSSKANVLNELVQRRDMMLPKPLIRNVEEPLYDHLLTTDGPKRGTLIVIPGSVKTYENGLHVMKPPVFGNEALYKGELVSTDSHFQGIEEVLCARLGSVTRWMLNKSNYPTSRYFDGRSPLYIGLCDLSLSTIVPYTFRDIFTYIPLSTKGEIFHRIPNMRYKTSAVIRSLPNSINLYNVSVNQEEINHRGLHDSNIHFDYITQRLKVKHTLAHKYCGIRPIIRRYYLENDPFIYDVSTWTNDIYVETPDVKWIPYTTALNKDINFGKMQYIASSYLISENYDTAIEIGSPALLEDLELSGDNIILSLLAQYYRALRRNRLILGLETTPSEIWAPLFEQMRSRYNLHFDMEGLDERNIINGYITRARMNFHGAVRRYNTDQVFDEVKAFLEDNLTDEADLIDDYISILRVVKFKKMPGDQTGKVLQQRDNDWGLTHLMLSPRRRASLALVASTIMNNCLTLSVNENVVTINRESAFEMFNIYLRKYIFVMENADNRLELFDILYHTYDSDTKIALFDDACTQLDEILVDFVPVDLDIPKTVLKYKITPSIRQNIQIAETAEKVRFLLDRVGTELFHEFTTASKLFNLMRHAANIYSHPAIFQSPTGSDSYSAQYALFLKMQQTGLIKGEDLVCDLTAGRGDGHLAMNRLGIHHISHARSDIFTALYSTEGIVEKNEYDVFDPATLEFVLIFDFIHIDISWTGKGKNDFTDTLLYLMRARKKFSVRLNSIDFTTLPVDFNEMASRYRFLITIPSVANLCPYQVYLIGYPSKDSMLPHDASCSETSYYYALKKRFMSLININNLLFAPNIAMQNSVSILIDNTLPPSTLCERLLNTESYMATKHKMDSLIDIILHPTMLAMPRTYFDSLRTDHEFVCKVVPPTYSAKEFGYTLDMRVGGTNRKKKEFWRKMCDTIVHATDELIYPLLESGCEDLLTNLQYDIPHPRIRGKVAVASQIMTHFGLQFPVGIEDIAQLSEKLRKDEGSYLNTSLRHVRIAILLIYYAAGINNYQFGILYLWCQLKIVKKNVFTTYKTLEIYRKLSGLYHIFRRSFIDGQENNRIFHRIQQEVIDIGLRNHDVQQYYITRRDIMKEQFNPLATPDVDTLRTQLFGEEAQKELLDSFDKIIDNPATSLTGLLSSTLDRTVDSLINNKLDITEDKNTFGQILQGFDFDSFGKKIADALNNYEGEMFEDEEWADADLE